MLPRGDGERGHPELRLSQAVQHQLLQTRRSVSIGGSNTRARHVFRLVSHARRKRSFSSRPSGGASAAMRHKARVFHTACNVASVAGLVLKARSQAASGTNAMTYLAGSKLVTLILSTSARYGSISSSEASVLGPYPAGQAVQAESRSTPQQPGGCHQGAGRAWLLRCWP